MRGGLIEFFKKLMEFIIMVIIFVIFSWTGFFFSKQISKSRWVNSILFANKNLWDKLLNLMKNRNCMKKEWLKRKISEKRLEINFRGLFWVVA